MKNKNTKSTLWNMRATKADKRDFAELSRRLGVKKAKAIRIAVSYMLQATNPQRISTPHAAITA